ncbi:hypothetical protein EWB00_002109 [Schistosoma japonicum]|uniref:Uncharacterized protein n=1 Tax=Schistosoma japonicum TaxID=6182 RepID=A0A4Z2CK04_SCHJA|nr:hypothetical protein EWB00_002109 [Schistosoma japonicum]
MVQPVSGRNPEQFLAALPQMQLHPGGSRASKAAHMQFNFLHSHFLCPAPRTAMPCGGADSDH